MAVPRYEQDTAVPAARCEELTKVYGEGDTRVRALDEVSVAFPAGQFTAIMGPSGSGKSTLMHCMAGLDTATSGRTYIGETDLTTLDDKRLTRLRRDAVGFVFQSYNLLPMLTAIENITLPMDIAGRKPDPAWLRTVVETVGLADRLKHRRCGCRTAGVRPDRRRSPSTPARPTATTSASATRSRCCSGAVVGTLRDDGISTLVIPVASLALYVVLAGVVGVLAAVLPARRAARLDVLRAVATT